LRCRTLTLNYRASNNAADEARQKLDCLGAHAHDHPLRGVRG
jgi:hypothetical protein